jgi:hypothetical protein
VTRNKQDACQYDSGAPTVKQQREQPGTARHTEDVSPGRDAIDSIPSKVANFGYSATGASTLGFLKKIESANPDEPLSRLNPDSNPHGDAINTRERYKSLIRQLPARTFIDRLVDIFFVDFNWQVK